MAIALAVLALALAGCGEADFGGSGPAGVDTGAWSTDFSEHSVPLSEFVSGGPGKDGIPAIDEPRFVPISEGDGFLEDPEPVAAVQTGPESAVVYPFSRLAREAPVEDAIGRRPVVVFYDPSVASPLDERAVAGGRPVGAAAVFDRRASGRTLSFRPGPDAGLFRDVETGSTWGMDGRATEGPLAGEQLAQLVSDDQFWFALAAFFPDAEVRRGP